MSVKSCLDAKKTSCDGVSAKEVTHVKSWRKFSKAYLTASNKTPVTAMLVALHNMITESVDKTWFATGRRQFACPLTVLAGLKAGILADDSEAQSFSLPSYEAVSGVPGLATNHGSVSCK